MSPLCRENVPPPPVAVVAPCVSIRQEGDTRPCPFFGTAWRALAHHCATGLPPLALSHTPRAPQRLSLMVLLTRLIVVALTGGALGGTPEQLDKAMAKLETKMNKFIQQEETRVDKMALEACWKDSCDACDYKWDYRCCNPTSGTTWGGWLKPGMCTSCANDGCESPTSKKFMKVGATCHYSYECASGRCCNDWCIPEDKDKYPCHIASG